VLSALAAASVLAGLRTIWLHTTADSAALGLVVSLGYAALLALIVVATCATRRRTVIRVDLCVLAVAVAIEAVQLHRFTTSGFSYGGDEGILTSQAMEALRHGHNPYAGSWASAVAQAPTQLMGGGIVDRYVYPPVIAVLGGAAGLIGPSLATPAFIDGLALIATAVVLFVVFPVALRPLAVLVVFGISFETSRAIAGAPGIVAVPFLVAALWRWPAIGAGGRLGRRGIIRAMCLGLAMATYQLAWFLLPFVAIGIWRMRRGELVRRASLLAVGRYVAVTLAVFVVVNAPFAALGFADWWHGITDVLSEHALIYGPGIAMVSGNLAPGSGALDFFTYAAAFAYVILLVVVAIAPRRLAAAVTVLPILIFWLAVRSEDTYYVVFAPLWILAVVTAVRTDFSTARPISLPARLAGPRARRLAIGAAALPVVACVAIGLLTPSPLRLSVTSTTRNTSQHLQTISVEVHNRSGHDVQPHFVLLGEAQLGVFWAVETGPSALAAGQSANYVLTNPGRGFQPAPGSRLRLEAVSDHPQTLSSVEIPISR
jgi:hypothetical protein